VNACIDFNTDALCQSSRNIINWLIYNDLARLAPPLLSTLKPRSLPGTSLPIAIRHQQWMSLNNEELI
jgi:hypothetical protein